jgi:hypothetical protein
MLDRSRRIVRLGAILLACGAFTAVPAATQPASPPKDVHFGTWGVDLTARDLSVKPGDDFQRYASGKWLDANPIPADKSSNSVGSEVNDRNQERCKRLSWARRRTASWVLSTPATWTKRCSKSSTWRR